MSNYSQKSIDQTLKKPSQFTKLENNSLKSPSTFQQKNVNTVKVKNKAPVRKPSDFVSTKPAKDQVTPLLFLNSNKSDFPTSSKQLDGILNVDLKKQILSQKNSKIQSKTGYVLQNNVLLSPSRIKASINLTAQEENSKLLEKRYAESQLKIQALKENFDEKCTELQAQKFEFENIIFSFKESEAKVTFLEQEKYTTKETLNHIEREHFLEIKELYCKYNSMQNQYEEEKRLLKSKIVKLEQHLSDSCCEKDNTHKNIEQLNFQHENLKKLMESQSKNYEDTFAKLKDELATRNQDIEKLTTENEDYSKKHQHSLNTIDSLTTELKERKKITEQLKLTLESQIKISENNSKEHSKGIIKIQSLVESTEEKLKAEVNRKTTLERTLYEKNSHIEKLEKNAARLQCFVDSINKDRDDAQRHMAKQIKLQDEEIKMLHHTCKTLQLTNEHLNVRLSSLNDVFCLQESSIGGVVDSLQKDNLLKVWRQKVYSLLVLLKTNDIQEKHNFDTHDSI